MNRIFLVVAFMLSIHACYAIDGGYSMKKKHKGPTKVEEPKEIMSPNGPPPPEGYQS